MEELVMKMEMERIGLMIKINVFNQKAPILGVSHISVCGSNVSS